jgi:leucyl/phenylalanyl-tRNA--protein transferase
VNSIVWLGGLESPTWFPPVEHALTEPDGLLAAGGDLAPQRLLSAYEQGIFPWYSAGQPILWWCPDPRAVLFPGELHVSRSLRRHLRTSGHETRIDTDFDAVIRGCAAPRSSGAGTWLTDEMIAAYQRLHDLGLAHSIETWHAGRVVGGLYGVALGRVFFGESMFSVETNASKVALVRLVREAQERGIVVIDCQVPNPHVQSLGSRSIPRPEFIALLREHCRPHRPGRWSNPDGDRAR